jgi:hypothetical protein
VNAASASETATPIDTREPASGTPSPRSTSVRPLACIGHSHLKCVIEAAGATDTSLVTVDLWTTTALEETSAGLQVSAAVRQRLGEGPIFSLVGGNPHHRLGLVMHPRPFDFILADAPYLPLDTCAEIIPVDGVRAALAEAARPHLDLMRLLPRALPGPIFHFESPPVAADARRLQVDVPWMFFHGRRRIAPRWLRYKLWRLHSAIMRESCERFGLTFVPSPSSAMDADGFLSSEYYLDAMHVNARYGALVLEQMKALM